jgi:phage terminase small subunit
MNKLTKKQEAFCREYVVDFNGTQAAIRAGYSEKTATVSASENLRKPNVQNFIKELQSDRKERLEITADELTEFFRMMKDDENQKGADRIKAAENLAKRFGYYEEHNKQKQPPAPPQIIIGD